MGHWAAVELVRVAASTRRVVQLEEKTLTYSGPKPSIEGELSSAAIEL